MPAKIGGTNRPCTKRQNTIAPSVVENPTITVGTARPNIAAMMTRRRPIMSETIPVQGAISATASGGALTVKLTATGLACNSSASSGNSDCVAQRSRKEPQAAQDDGDAARIRNHGAGVSGHGGFC